MSVVQHYDRKPEAVEAVKLTPENVEAVANWCGGEVVEIGKSSDPTDVYRTVKFPTLEGPMAVGIGEYLVKNERGAFCRVVAMDFEAKYNVALDPVEPPVEQPSDPVDPPAEEIPNEEYIPSV